MDERVDRQVRVLGKRAQRDISQSSVLVVGLGGLGVEIVKNLLLTGFKTLGIFDNKKVDYFDLGSQFFCSEEDVGKKTRLEASWEELKSLNPHCKIINETFKPILSTPLLKKYDIVVFTENHIAELSNLNQFCHDENIKFVAAECRGLFGSIFVDFGDEFICHDTTGEREAQGVLSKIHKDESGNVWICTKNPDDLQVPNLSPGDVVKLFNVEKVDELNDKVFKLVDRSDAFTYSIGKIDADIDSNACVGARFVQVKEKKTLSFEPLEKSIENTKEFIMYNLSKLSTPKSIHVLMRMLKDFVDKYERIPLPHSEKDYVLFQELNVYDTKIDKELCKTFSYTCRGLINPMVTFFGGIIAQEVVKGSTGKYHPIHQWFHFESSECVLGVEKWFQLSESDFQPLKCRYDSQIVVFGRRYQQKFGDLKYFLVGCGALGCEFVKNYAMCGISCGPKGELSMVDMDEIELSNLSRQFLFRDEHVGQMKSECAGKQAVKMNPSINVSTFVDPVGPMTEQVFHQTFWQRLDGIMNALDNIQGRKYVDSKAVQHLKVMFDSGTLGSKAHTQVILPKLTINYSGQKDVKHKEFPECTVHVFPSVILHTISWAKRLFITMFHSNVNEVKCFLSNPNEYFQKNEKKNPENLEVVHKYLLMKRMKNFDDCVVYSRNLFQYFFNHDIRNILLVHPVDQKTKNGGRFWSGSKRSPSPVEFDKNNKSHLRFVFSCASLLAKIYSIERVVKMEEMKIPEEKVEKYVPNQSEIRKKEKDAKTTVFFDAEYINKLKIELIERKEEYKDVKLQPLKFEKNDEMHILYVTSCSNSRATCYSIPKVGRHETKGIVGNIIPAMITTTAAATGLIFLELYKWHQGIRDISNYANSFMNIGLNLILLSEPLPPKKLFGNYTIWDQIRVERKYDITLGEFISFLEGSFNCNVLTIHEGGIEIYSLKIPTRQLMYRLDSELRRLTEICKMNRFPSNMKSVVYKVRLTKDKEMMIIPVVYSVENPI